MFYICSGFCHVTLNLAETLVVKSQVLVPHGAILYFILCLKT